MLTGGDDLLKLIPVLDLLSGQVVRGVAGNRELYQPNASQLVDCSDPLATAQAFQRLFNIESLYIADLDALQERPMALSLIAALAETGLKLTVDAAVTTPEAAQQLLDCGVERVVVPSESIANLDSLEQVLSTIGSERTVFSLDLKQGRPMGMIADQKSLLSLVQEVVDLGIESLIVLDLSGVGSRGGVLTQPLSEELLAANPHLRIWTGGGIRNIADLMSLQTSGIDGVMIASALHDGHITPEDWERCSQQTGPGASRNCKLSPE